MRNFVKQRSAAWHRSSAFIRSRSCLVWLARRIRVRHLRHLPPDTSPGLVAYSVVLTSSTWRSRAWVPCWMTIWRAVSKLMMRSRPQTTAGSSPRWASRQRIRMKLIHSAGSVSPLSSRLGLRCSPSYRSMLVVTTWMILTLTWKMTKVTQRSWRVRWMRKRRRLRRTHRIPTPTLHPGRWSPRRPPPRVRGRLR